MSKRLTTILLCVAITMLLFVMWQTRYYWVFGEESGGRSSIDGRLAGPHDRVYWSSDGTFALWYQTDRTLGHRVPDADQNVIRFGDVVSTGEWIVLDDPNDFIVYFNGDTPPKEPDIPCVWIDSTRYDWILPEDANVAELTPPDDAAPVDVVTSDDANQRSPSPDSPAATSLTFCPDGDWMVELTWGTGKLDLIGDPNHFTETAKIFLTQAIPGAAYEIVRGDDIAIRRLAESGRICEVLGHQWVWPDGVFACGAGYVGGEHCGLCGEARTYTVECCIGKDKE